MADAVNTNQGASRAGARAPDDVLPADAVRQLGSAVGTTGPETQLRTASDFLEIARQRLLELKLVARANRLFRDGLDARQGWDETSDRVRDIMRSEMWPASASAIGPEVRVSINRIRPIGVQMKSQLMQTRPTIAVRQQAPEDTDLSWVFHRQIQWSIEQGSDQRTIARAVDDFGEIGIAIVRDRFDPRLDDGQGELNALYVDPKHVLIDTNARADGWEDANWIIQFERRLIEDAEEDFPELKDKIIEEQRDAALFPETADRAMTERRRPDYGTASARATFTALGTDGSDQKDGEEPFRDRYCVQKEFWYRRLVKRKMRFISDEITAISLELPEMFAGSGLWPIPDYMDMPPEVEVIEHEATDVEWWCATIIGDSLAQHVRSPYPLGHPYTFFTNRMHANSAWPTGDLQHLVGINDLLNKVWSMIVENAAKTKNSGYIVEEGALTPKQLENLQNFGSLPGHIATVNRDAIRMGRIMEAKPAQLPRGLFEIAKELQSQMDFVVQQFEVNRGGAPYATSGKGILALQTTGRSVEQLRQILFSFGLTQWARKRLANIQTFYTEYKMLRIIGDAGEERFVEVNVPVDDPMRGEIKRVNDLSVGKYDVIVRIDQQKQYTRQERTEVASWLFLQKIADPEYVLDALEIPEKDAILQRKAQRDPIEQLAQAAQRDPNMAQAIQALRDPQVVQMVAYLQNPEMKQMFQQLVQDPNALRAMRQLGTAPAAQPGPAGQQAGMEPERPTAGAQQMGVVAGA